MERFLQILRSDLTALCVKMYIHINITSDIPHGLALHRQGSKDRSQTDGQIAWDSMAHPWHHTQQEVLITWIDYNNYKHLGSAFQTKNLM